MAASQALTSGARWMDVRFQHLYDPEKPRPAARRYGRHYIEMAMFVDHRSLQRHGNNQRFLTQYILTMINMVSTTRFKLSA